MSNTITITSNLGRDGELKFTRSGEPVLELSLPETPRKRVNGEWQDDGPTTWFRCSIWGKHAEAIANSGIAVKGARVTVTGILKVGSYEKDGETRVTHDVAVKQIGIELKRDTQTAGAPIATAQPQSDPWAREPAPSQEAPF